jgi:hypothetical protein
MDSYEIIIGANIKLEYWALGRYRKYSMSKGCGENTRQQNRRARVYNVKRRKQVTMKREVARMGKKNAVRDREVMHEEKLA